MIYDIIIIGAGLAGCSAAIQLANHGLKILLLEQQKYPHHKLCGEFLSIEVIEIFNRLGILESVFKANAHPIHHALLTASSGATFAHNLPSTALGLSRYRLDLTLFEKAQTAGATCHDNTNVQTMTGDLSLGFTVTTNREIFRSRMVLGAYGKRSRLDHPRPFHKIPTPWVAHKAHYSGLDLPHTIELHAFNGGYCGLSAIETGEINLCWIGHSRVLNTGNRNLPDALYTNPYLRDRLQHLTCNSSTNHSLSQISFDRKGNFHNDICMIGDTAGMITPLCGDGMAMALRTAEIAIPLVLQHLDKTLTTPQFKRQYSQQWQQEFNLRLNLGKLMHNAFIHPPLAQASVSLCHHIPAIGDWLIRNTRGHAPESTSQILDKPQYADR
jgi:menaquinone-9 beta-reductase